jgi:hypothetical protein
MRHNHILSWKDGIPTAQFETSMLLTLIPADLITVDSRIPDRDTSFVPDHLVYCLSKSELLPAVSLQIEGERATIVRGHKYLEAARILGRTSIRCVITSPPTSADVKQFLARSDVSILDWEEIRARESSDTTPVAWHVFYFDRPLSAVEKADFDSRVNALFEGIETAGVRVLHDDRGPGAEYRVKTPVSDEDWARRSLQTFAAFAEERVGITSYQGRRFGPAGR